MELLKKDDTGPAVRRLTERLVQLGYLAAATETFDSLVAMAVRNFQSSHVGPDGRRLKMDGVAGPLTQFAIAVALGEVAEPPNMSLPTPDITARPAGASISGWNALQVAKREMADGAREIGGNNMGPFCRKYHAITGSSEGEAWCSAFVSYCFKESNPGAMPYAPTAGARDTLQTFKTKGWAYTATFENHPLPGDIIVWWRGKKTGWQGHIGIVSGYADGIVYTIEGNATPRVENFSYVLGQIDKLLGFARAKPAT